MNWLKYFGNERKIRGNVGNTGEKKGVDTVAMGYCSREYCRRKESKIGGTSTGLQLGEVGEKGCLDDALVGVVPGEQLVLGQLCDGRTDA